jgi:predicted MFS family arabinose efflux permease
MARKMPVVRRQHQIDYLGAAAIVGAVTCLLLYLDWRGNSYGWTDPGGLALLAASVLLAVAFILVERRAAEPIIPLRLFRNQVFTIGNAYGFLGGVAFFGGIIFLPIYLQAVKGMSPTRSGLALLPAIIGIFSTSITSGQLITRTGRYKLYPILGAVVLAAALLLLSTLGVDTPFWRVALYEYLFGAGLGLTMQTIVTAVQNAVAFRDLGAATSSVTFFRQLGGSIGTAVFGAVLSSRLAHYLTEALAQAGIRSGAGGVTVNANNVQAIQRLAEPVKSVVLGAFSHALDDVFLIGVPFIALAFVVALFLREVPLRAGPGAPGAPGSVTDGKVPAQASGAPSDRPSAPREGRT